jgi:asparagine synthetase B (glutamine-hydrolysing)
MSGWVVVRDRSGRGLDERLWRRTLRAAARHGEPVESRVLGGIGVAAWRRSSGEFPRSGTLSCSAGGKWIAWLGQLVDDDGDATDAAIELLTTSSNAAQGAARLNGPFAAAVISPEGVQLWTDRHGHYPVYVHESAVAYVASAQMRCVLPWIARPEVDRESVGLLLRMGGLLDQRTIVRGVETLPGGSVTTLAREARETKRYWRLNHRPAPGTGLDAVSAQLAELLKSGVRRIQAASPRLGVPLSGGLDSRLLLGLCAAPDKIPSFTFGLEGCRDIRYAETFARAIGSPHRVMHWDPAEFPLAWPIGVDATGGSYGVTEMYVLPYASLFASECDVTLNGLGGDTGLGGNFLKQSWLRANSLRELSDLVWRWKVTPETERWADRLMSDTSDARPAREIWSASLCAEEDGTPGARLMNWMVENRTFRYVNCGTMLLRTAVESHAPFFDRDYVDLLLTVPLEYRLKHRLYLSVLQRASAVAARVPWQRTALPPAWGFPLALASLAAHRVVREIGKRTGLDLLASMRMHDPEGWFRAGPWHDFARSILDSERCRQRGIFDADAARELLAAQESGCEMSPLIGVALAVELFCRRELDAASAEGRDDALAAEHRRLDAPENHRCET